MEKPELSVVIPLYDEEESVEPLLGALRVALSEVEGWEAITVDDGSTDGTLARLHAAAEEDGRIRVVQLARNYGQTAAMQAGFDASRGEVIVSMDGDLQNDPLDILLLVSKLHEGYDIVVGYRVGRKDPLLTRKIPSRVANWLIGRVTGVRIRDNGCSLKAFRKPVLERLHLYSDMHRFIPAVAAATVGARVAQVPVRHHARRFGHSKYGLSRIWKVVSDMLLLRTLARFREAPLLVFGGASLVALVVGTLFGVGSVVSLETLRPTSVDAWVFPSVAVLWISLAFFLLLLGLIGEVLLRWYRPTKGPTPLFRAVPPC